MPILVIVESPGKIKSVEHYLGKGYKAMASFGHIMDLDRKTMSVDIEHDFAPEYKVTPDKKEVVRKLKSAASSASEVLLASDNDREGEFISWSVAKVLGLKNPKRLRFGSITKSELAKAIKKPDKIDKNLVQAQQARRILDRIVGYTLSPLLSKKVKGGSMSAGRVQSVIVRLIVDREKEIKTFLSNGADSYYRVCGTFNASKIVLNTVLHDLKKKDKKHFEGEQSKLSPNDTTDEPKDVMAVLKDCAKSTFMVKHVFEKEGLKQPSAPYLTSTLQQDAARKLGFPVKKTMQVAQKLYEKGRITYMRTDSTNLSPDAHSAIKAYVLATYGKKYYREKEYKTKEKHAQEAHEAIRPTDFNNLNAGDNDDERRLYTLIWKRTVASQMSPATTLKTFMQISISRNDKYYFESSIEKIVFPGFLKVYNIKNLEKEEGDEEEILGEDVKVPKEGTELTMQNIVAKQDYSKPPPRYNEASLLKNMKKLEIGRPATVASLITTIQERGYVTYGNSPGVSKQSHVFTLTNKKKIEVEEKTINLAKDTKKLIPTDLGMIVTEYLLENFSEIMDYQFTALMEEKLDKVASGEKQWTKVLQKFYDKFKPLVDKAQKAEGKYSDKFNRKLGVDSSGREIVATRTRNGPAVRLAIDEKHAVYADIKEPLTIETITLKEAMKLLKEKAKYPMKLGVHQGVDVMLNKGKFGFYLRMGDTTANVPDDKITLSDAVKLLVARKKSVLKQFETDKKSYTIMEGKTAEDGKKYNNYVSIVNKKSKIKKKSFVSLPADVNLEELTIEKLEKLIDEGFEKKKNRFGKRKFGKKKGEAGENDGAKPERQNTKQNARQKRHVNKRK